MTHVEHEPNSGCWLWSGPLGGRMGYGRFYRRGQQYTAHKWAYERAHGPLNGAFALHKCDTPCCVNPGHLFAGTARDNIHDCRSKGRLSPARGSRHVSAKLTEAAVIEAWFSTEKTPVIARRLGLPLRALEMVRRRQTWQHLTSTLPTREQAMRLARLVFAEDDTLVEAIMAAMDNDNRLGARAAISALKAAAMGEEKP